MPSIWSNLDFSKAKKPVTMQAVKRYILNAQGKVQRTAFNKFRINPDMLKYLTTRCIDLHEMSFIEGTFSRSLSIAAYYAENLKTLTLSFHCAVGLGIVHEVLCHCRALEDATFHNVITSTNCPSRLGEVLLSLRHLTIASHMQNSAEDRRPGSFLMSIFQMVPNIITLNFPGWMFEPLTLWLIPSNLRQLVSLELNTIDGAFAEGLPDSLQTLFLVTRAGMVHDHRSTLPNLARFALCGVSQVVVAFDDLQAWLSGNKGNLTYLDLSLSLLENGLMEQLAVCRIRSFS